jgi:hypothetical protein
MGDFIELAMLSMVGTLYNFGCRDSMMRLVKLSKGTNEHHHALENWTLI